MLLTKLKELRNLMKSLNEFNKITDLKGKFVEGKTGVYYVYDVIYDDTYTLKLLNEKGDVSQIHGDPYILSETYSETKKKFLTHNKYMSIGNITGYNYKVSSRYLQDTLGRGAVKSLFTQKMPKDTKFIYLSKDGVKLTKKIKTDIVKNNFIDGIQH